MEIPPQAKLYFGFGSNLSVSQMHARCNQSHYVGIGKFQGFRWIINERGYANVVEVTPASDRSNHCVWGLIFWLHPDDEPMLDRNEGVPYAYTKEMHAIDFWPAKLHELRESIDVEEKPMRKEALVYIDRKRITNSAPREEYIVRMNRGIDDALRFGIPQSYVDEVLRRFIPANGTVNEETMKLAEEQALFFTDAREENRTRN